MSPLRCLCASFAVPFMLMVTTQAGPSPPHNDGGNLLNGKLLFALASPPTKVHSGAMILFRQLAAEFVQDGYSTMSALQTRLALLEQSLWQLLVATSHIPPHPDAAGARQREDVVTSRSASDEAAPDAEDREEKRDILSPTQRVIVRREIMRRLRLQAPEPVELPIGMRFKKGQLPAKAFPDFQSTYQDGVVGGEKRGGDRMTPSRRAAILAAIMRQLDQSRQPVELTGMRGGK